MLATHNPGKLAELTQLVGPAVTCLSARALDLPEPAEGGRDYRENAAIKARAAALAAGVAALGDDTGLSIDALEGRPGLQTRPWAEALGGWDAALARLWAELEQREPGLGERGAPASLCCALALALPDRSAHVVLAEIRGVVRWPLGPAGPGLLRCFVPDVDTLDPNRPLPHRRRAFDLLRPALAQALGARLPGPREG